MNLENNFSTYKEDSQVDDEIDLKLLLKTFLREKKLIFLITLISTLFSIFYTFNQKSIYSGNFQIVVREEEDKNLGNSSFGLSSLIGNANNPKAVTQKLILKSPLVLDPIYKSVKSSYKDRGENVKDLNFNKWLNKKMRIDYVEKSDVLNINFIDEDKKLILNTLNKISNS